MTVEDGPEKARSSMINYFQAAAIAYSLDLLKIVSTPKLASKIEHEVVSSLLPTHVNAWR